MTVWTSAWLHGSVAADDVLDSLLPWAELHEVVAADENTALQLDLPEPTAVPVSPAMLLATLRRNGATSARLMLPVPGDVRGLGPVRGPFGAEALRAGQALLLPEAELGVVPVRIADGILRWTVHRVGAGRGVDFIGLAEAEHALRGAVREAAATLSALDIARHRPEVRKEIAETLASRPRPPWPAGTPGRVLRVLEQADEVAAILAAAAGETGGGVRGGRSSATAGPLDPSPIDASAGPLRSGSLDSGRAESGAVSAAELAARSAALRPLAAAVRIARLAAVAEAVRTLTDNRAERY
jgi:hypothetical protein